MQATQPAHSCSEWVVSWYCLQLRRVWFWTQTLYVPDNSEIRDKPPSRMEMSITGQFCNCNYMIYYQFLTSDINIHEGSRWTIPAASASHIGCLLRNIDGSDGRPGRCWMMMHEGVYQANHYCCHGTKTDNFKRYKCVHKLWFLQRGVVRLTFDPHHPQWGFFLVTPLVRTF